ncbi:hypothetical protein K438DRAFT_1749328 [Mycena galopus ATCC 62051]|nr:hypothetical protein K438DRAFT_1749328 [Mycena galopus ATCC 62051]
MSREGHGARRRNPRHLLLFQRRPLPRLSRRSAQWNDDGSLRRVAARAGASSSWRWRRTPVAREAVFLRWGVEVFPDVLPQINSTHLRSLEDWQRAGVQYIQNGMVRAPSFRHFGNGIEDERGLLIFKARIEPLMRVQSDRFLSLRALSAEEAVGLGLDITARDSDAVVPARLEIYLVLAVIAAGVGFLYLAWLFIKVLWSRCRHATISKRPSSIEAGLQEGSVSGVSGASSNLVEKGAPQAELRGQTPAGTP